MVWKMWQFLVIASLKRKHLYWTHYLPALHYLLIFADGDDDGLSLGVVLRLNDHALDAVQEEPD